MFITDEEINGLPSDPLEAFVKLENIVRERLEDAISKQDANYYASPLQRKYMSTILRAAQHYNIEELTEWKRPRAGFEEEDWIYPEFISDVEYCVMGLRLSYLEKEKANSVQLNAAIKEKINHLLIQLRESVNSLNISESKKERIRERINSLQKEVDNERTKLEVYAALFVDVCATLDKGISKLENSVRILERVGAALGIAKQEEDNTPRLPKHKEPKKIEPPKTNNQKEFSKGSFEKSHDDEIPF